MSRIWALLLTLGLLFVSAVPAAAVPPLSNSVSMPNLIYPPGSSTIFDVEEATIEVGEPTASCAVGGDDGHSVWFVVSVPAGKLTIKTSTVEADYDTVITLYERPQVLSVSTLGPELACAVKPGAAATLKANVSGDQYLVRIASDDASALSSRTLTYSVKLKPPTSGLVPNNDGVENAMPVVFNKATNVQHYQYSTHDIDDPIPVCSQSTPLNSLWFTFTGPSGQVLVTTEGSSAGFEPEAYGTPLAVAVYSGSPGSLSYVDCDDFAGLNGAGRLTFTAVANTTYYVVVYHDISGSLVTVPSTARLLVVHESHSVGINPDFTDDLNGWTVKDATGDGLANDSGTPNNNNAFRFVGGPNEKSRLGQKVNVPSNLFVPARSVLRIGYKVESQTAVLPYGKLTLGIKVKYADGQVVTYKEPVSVPIATGIPATRSYAFQIDRKNPVSLTFTLKNKAASGDVAIDDLHFRIEPTLATRAAPAGVLALPPAP